MKYLDLNLPLPAENLACDEALLEGCETGSEGEVLRFWESRQYFVVVGYANRVASEVNLVACDAHQIPILRRCSGGGTVVQGPGCLNYCLVLKMEEGGPLFTVPQANQFIMQRQCQAFRRLLGETVRIQGHTDLTWGPHKFSGNAQRRKRQSLVFHGTVLLDFDLAHISRYLAMPSQQPDYRLNRSHDAFVTNTSLDRDQVKTVLREVWGAHEPLGAAPDLSALMAERYGKADWHRKF